MDFHSHIHAHQDPPNDARCVGCAPLACRGGGDTPWLPPHGSPQWQQVLWLPAEQGKQVPGRGQLPGQSITSSPPLTFHTK